MGCCIVSVIFGSLQPWWPHRASDGGNRPHVFGAQRPIVDGEHGQPTTKQAPHHLAIALLRPSLPSCIAVHSLTASRVRTDGHERKPGREAITFGNPTSFGTLRRAETPTIARSRPSYHTGSPQTRVRPPSAHSHPAGQLLEI